MYCCTATTLYCFALDGRTLHVAHLTSQKGQKREKSTKGEEERLSEEETLSGCVMRLVSAPPTLRVGGGYTPKVVVVGGVGWVKVFDLSLQKVQHVRVGGGVVRSVALVKGHLLLGLHNGQCGVMKWN